MGTQLRDRETLDTRKCGRGSSATWQRSIQVVFQRMQHTRSRAESGQTKHILPCCGRRPSTRHSPAHEIQQLLDYVPVNCEDVDTGPGGRVGSRTSGRERARVARGARDARDACGSDRKGSQEEGSEPEKEASERWNEVAAGRRARACRAHQAHRGHGVGKQDLFTFDHWKVMKI
eukprot:SAG11_NODE_288_length_11198_cov_29.339130_5_plen_175_part_00